MPSMLALCESGVQVKPSGHSATVVATGDGVADPRVADAPGADVGDGLLFAIPVGDESSQCERKSAVRMSIAAATTSEPRRTRRAEVVVVDIYFLPQYEVLVSALPF